MSSNSTANTSLTTHLLSLLSSDFRTATQTPFLEKAGKGTLSKEVLQKWLAQDRLYAQAYIRFASLLLANVPMSAAVKPDSINEQLVDVLIDSITNVRRELKFFEDVAGRYGLKLEAEEVSEGVKRYRDLFFSVGEGIERHEQGIISGLVVLWGTEKCYLEAWRYAASQNPAYKPSSATMGEGGENEGQEDADGGALRREFIPNWTSSEFALFVDRIGWFVDELWKEDSGFVGRNIGVVGKPGPMLKRDLEGLWRELLDVERVFWPVVE